MGNQKLGFLHGARERESKERIQVDGGNFICDAAGPSALPNCSHGRSAPVHCSEVASTWLGGQLEALARAALPVFAVASRER
jgi:hypothetical protein